MSEILGIEQSGGVVASLKAELETASPDQKQRIRDAILLAALSSIPWVGGVLSAAATYRSEESGARRDDIIGQWLNEHQARLLELRGDLESMFARFDSLGAEIEDRIQSEEYLAIVRRAFHAWDQAATRKKRDLIMSLLTNAAGTRVCSDDILRLFMDWIELYHEAHFAVIGEIYGGSGPTRYEIWVAVYGPDIPREDSPEADLYKMLIRDLSTGGVIRQRRETDSEGRFRKRPTGLQRRASSGTMESAFEDTKQYVLTGLGEQFVHYTMTDLVPRIGSQAENDPLEDTGRDSTDASVP